MAAESKPAEKAMAETGALSMRQQHMRLSLAAPKPTFFALRTSHAPCQCGRRRCWDPAPHPHAQSHLVLWLSRKLQETCGGGGGSSSSKRRRSRKRERRRRRRSSSSSTTTFTTVGGSSGVNTHSPPAPSALCTLLSILLSYLSVCSLSLAQQKAPLAGQGWSPQAQGIRMPSVPVYISIDLAKLVSVDEDNYEFMAEIVFSMAWSDPRADRMFQLSALAAAEAGAARRAAAARCQAQLAAAAAAAAAAEPASARGSAEAAASVERADSSGAEGAAAKVAVGGGSAVAVNVAVEMRTNSSGSSGGGSVDSSSGQAGDDGGTNDCAEALSTETKCTRFCSTYGGDASADSDFCCDGLWLPDIELANVKSMPQDRVSWELVRSLLDGNGSVLRDVSVMATFYSPMNFRTYPFDQQELQVFMYANSGTTYGYRDFYLVPSTLSRDYVPRLVEGPNRTASLAGLYKDELSTWSITSMTFSCTEAVVSDFNTTLGYTFVDPNPSDPYAKLVALGIKEEGNSKSVVCGLSIFVSRLPLKAGWQSVYPVALIGMLSFTVFFTLPDAIDVRLGTGVTLFLSLTAVQFIFSAILPTTSYLTDFDQFIIISYFLIVVIMVENLGVYLLATREEHWKRKGYKRVGSDDGSDSDGSSSSSSSSSDESIGDGAASNGISEEGGGNSGLRESGDVEEGSRGWAYLTTSQGWLGRIHNRKSYTREEVRKYYRIACIVDVVSGTVFAFLYVVISVLNFVVDF